MVLVTATQVAVAVHALGQHAQAGARWLQLLGVALRPHHRWLAAHQLDMRPQPHGLQLGMQSGARLLELRGFPLEHRVTGFPRPMHNLAAEVGVVVAGSGSLRPAISPFLTSLAPLPAPIVALDVTEGRQDKT